MAENASWEIPGEEYSTEILRDTTEEESEEPLTTDYTVTTLTVTEAGSYWLTGYDPINKKAGVAYPNCREVDASECSGDVLIVGNEKNNLLLAGTGKSSLWGGLDGKDTMQGGSARDLFWYGNGDSNDTVWDFTPGEEETSDVLVLYSGSVASVSRLGTILTLKMSDGSGLTVQSSSGADDVILYSWDAKDIQKAKIGNSNGNNTMSYTEEVLYYQGGSKKDILTLSGGTEAKLIWLDGSQKASYNSIDVIDGSQSSGADQLAGTTASESLVGGRAAASLWGGTGSASDTLRAGTGENILFYGYGEGDDVIQNTYRNDTVMLYNIGLDQISATNINGELISIRTTAGQTLTVNGKTELFVLGDGANWKPDRNSGTWQKL
ncbi:hypothetical protein [Selenomonas sp. AB3002]|uniref:hypothetical protein n=1 Tax=Selenomonas sp. AB3002 TaxID=1392502 RepID=UPI0004961F0E